MERRPGCRGWHSGLCGGDVPEGLKNKKTTSLWTPGARSLPGPKYRPLRASESRSGKVKNSDEDDPFHR